MNHFPIDWILIVRPSESPQLGSETLHQAIQDVESRLDSVRCAIWSGESDDLRTMLALGETPDRLVIVPWSLFQISRSELRAGLWFSGASPSTSVFLAEPPTAQELGRWIGNASMRDGLIPSVELIPPSPPDLVTIDQLATIAYWTGQDCNCWIRGDKRHEDSDSSRLVRGYIAFTYDSIHGSNKQQGDRILPWEWLAPAELSTWVIGRYLQALNRHPFIFTENPDHGGLLQVLKELADQQYSILPTDYCGKLDAVTPSSMGSASLAYDSEGKVPWDRVWTSFCDLAMAGGPPHRGTLLSNVQLEEIELNREQYDWVVDEIRRGIELASRLSTCESKTLGWVGVCCHDERMAAWMLRAIIVENILVRREGATLFLPAGPGFRVEKEIKNVITAVAKTTHYWFGHLKTRQPPKPL